MNLIQCLFLWITFFECLFSNEIQFIKSTFNNLPIQEYTESVGDLKEILLEGLNLNLHDYVNTPSHLSNSLRDSLRALSNDALSLVHNYWVIVVIGQPVTSSSDPIRNENSQTVLKIKLDREDTKLNLNDLLSFNSKDPGISKSIHVSEIIQRNTFSNSLVIYSSKELNLLLNFAPTSLPVFKLHSNYISGTVGFIKKLEKERDFKAETSKQLFGIEDSELLENNSYDLFHEFKEFLNLLKYLKTSNTKNGKFNYYNFLSLALSKVPEKNKPIALSYINKYFIPKIVESFNGLYGQDSVGVILYLNRINEELSTRFEGIHQDGTQGLIYSAASTQSSFPYCYLSEEECLIATSKCSDHGECQNIFSSPMSNKNEAVCWRCVCDAESGMTGDCCQFEDWSEPFWIFFFAFLVLFLVIAWSVFFLLYSGSSSTCSWVFKSSDNLKED